MSPDPMAAPSSIIALVALVVVVVIMLAAAVRAPARPPCGCGPPSCSDHFTPAAGQGGGDRPADGYPFSNSVASSSPWDAGTSRYPVSCDPRSVQLGRTSEGIDPLVTGQLYARSRQAGANRRFVYADEAPRPACSDPDLDGCGIPGVGAGPLDPATEVFDSGIPERWRFPGRPLVFGAAPAGADHYDPMSRTAVACVNGARPLREPDHEPQTS